MIKIVTLNCWKDEADIGARLPMIEAGLGELDADIICLQEVYSGPGLCVARRLANALDRTLCAHPARAKMRRGAFSSSGLAVLSRWTIAVCEAIELPTLAADGQRIAQHVVLNSPYGQVGVLNIHLSHLRGEDGMAIRARQIASAVEWALRDRQGLCVIAGDFNAALHASELDAFRHLFAPDFGADLVGLQASTLRGRDDAPIDHVGLLGGEGRWRVCDRKLVLDAADRSSGVWPSDHFGVAVTLEATSKATNTQTVAARPPMGGAH